MRKLIGRIGESAVRMGGVNRESLRAGIQDEWPVWNRLVQTVASGVKSEVVQYGRRSWPAVIKAAEEAAVLRVGREVLDAEGDDVFRPSLTFTQKVMVCLRRLSREQVWQPEGTNGNDARCWRFTRKIISTFGRGEDESVADRQRYLHLEVVRLTDLCCDEGEAIRQAGVEEARSLLAWVEGQQLIEGKMRVPKFGEGASLVQMRRLVASRLVTRGAEDRTLAKNTGLTPRTAREMARRHDKAKDRERAERLYGRQNQADKRSILEQAELSARDEFAGAMLRQDLSLAQWLLRGIGLGLQITMKDLRFGTADVDEAMSVVKWYGEAGEGAIGHVKVLVARKDRARVPDGVIESMRKTLGLEIGQVVAEEHAWNPRNERIVASDRQNVLSLRVEDLETIGRVRGMHRLAKSIVGGRSFSLSALQSMRPEAWQNVIDAVRRARPNCGGSVGSMAQDRRAYQPLEA